MEKNNVDFAVQLDTSNDGFIAVLFSCVMLSLFPIVLASIVSPGLVSERLYTLIVGCVFSIQIAVLYFYYINFEKIKVQRRLFFLALAFPVAETTTLLISTVKGIQIENLDFVFIIARFLCVLLFLCIPASLSISEKGLKSFMSLVVWLGVIACIYNMIVNFAEMMNILNINNPYAVNFKSFYVNRNSFAQLLFFSVIANTFLFIKQGSIKNWFSFGIIGINIIAALSRTVLASIGIFIIFFCMLHFRKKLSILVMMSILLGMMALVVISSPEISSFVVNMLIREDIGTANRSDLWLLGIEIINQSNLFFGTGYMTGANVLRNSGSMYEFHNFYIETLVGGGIVELLFHLIIFSLVLGKIKTIYENDEKTGILYFGSYFALMFYAFFESISFLSIGYVSTLFTTFFITVPILYSNGFYSQHERVCDKGSLAQAKR